MLLNSAIRPMGINAAVKTLVTTSFVRAEAAANSSSEASQGGEQFEFQAETKSLLDIVAKSLYSDQEVIFLS